MKLGCGHRRVLLGLASLALVAGCRSAASSSGSAVTSGSSAIASDAHPTLGSTDPFEREIRKAIGRETERQARLRAVRETNREIADRWRAQAPERLREEQRRSEERERQSEPEPAVR